MTKSKFFMFLTVLFFLSAVVFSQTITVTSPHSGDSWCIGSTHNITWTKTGNAGVNVKINIFKDQIDQAHYIPGSQIKCLNSGTKSWQIPNTYATGTYYIRIKGVDSNWNDVGVYGDSDAFTIKSCGVVSPGTFRIPRLSMSLAELAVFMHGPGPRIRELGQVRSILEKNNIKTPVIMQLYKGEKLFMNLGTFTPTYRGRQMFFKTIPNELKLNFTKEQRMMLKSVKGLKLVLKTNGKVIGTKLIPYKQSVKERKFIKE